MICLLCEKPVDVAGASTFRSGRGPPTIGPLFFFLELFEDEVEELIMVEISVESEISNSTSNRWPFDFRFCARPWGWRSRRADASLWG